MIKRCWITGREHGTSWLSSCRDCTIQYQIFYTLECLLGVATCALCNEQGLDRDFVLAEGLPIGVYDD